MQKYSFYITINLYLFFWINISTFETKINHMASQTPVFAKIDKSQFFRTLNKRVNEYFKENNLKKTGNWKLHLKTISSLLLFSSTRYAFLGLYFIKYCDWSWNGWSWNECYA